MTLSPGTKRVLLSTLIVASVFVITVAMPLSSPRDAGRTWAASLSAAQRAHFLESAQIAQLPVEYRQALVGSTASPAEKAAFWRGVFARYRASHVVSASQASLLGDAESLLTPEIFSPDLTRSARATVLGPLHVVQKAVAASLGVDAARELFVSGGPERVSAAALPWAERLTAAVRRQRTLMVASNTFVPRLLAISCNCNQGQNDCYYGTWCTPPSQTSYGSCSQNSCGFLWLEDCNGLCSYTGMN